MQKPPPLPAETLAKVVRISALDGFSLTFIASGFGLVSVFYADWLGAAVGGLAAGAGWLELHGRRRLRAGDAGGVRWLVRSQLVLLVIILLYVAYQLHSFNPEPLLAKVEEALSSAQRSLGLEVTPLADSLGLTKRQFLEFAQHTVRVAYLAVGVLSILFQGGLAFYYHRQEQGVARALRKI